MAADPIEQLAATLGRRGLAGPLSVVLDAHRPLRPFLLETAIFLEPLLRPLGGTRGAAMIEMLGDDAAYERMVGRLRYAAARGRDAEPG